MKLSELMEDAVLVKFSYKSPNSHDPKPEVKVLDFKYLGQKGQKSYGKREDILGFNVNNFENKEYAKRAIDEIDSFARLLSANKEEKYKRIKYFFPQAVDLIRRYQVNNIKDIKTKDDGSWFWKRSNIENLIDKDKGNY